MTTRFSKGLIQEHIEFKVRKLVEQYGFREDRGWAQVERKPIDAIVAYGEFSALCELLDDMRFGIEPL